MAIAVYPDGGFPPISVATLLNANDEVRLPVSGNDWATVVWTVTTAGNGGITAEYSTDAGGSPTNWLTPPLTVRTDAVSSNPSVAPWANNSPVAGTFETTLPADCTAFRIRHQTAGTATAINLKGGKRYFPGMPVVAVLFDTATTAGAANNTGTLQSSGWSSLTVSLVETSAATGAASLNIVDDAGNAIAVGTSAGIATGTYVFGWGNGAFGSANPFTMSGGITQLAPERRFNIAVAGATTSATRIRILARR